LPPRPNSGFTRDGTSERPRRTTVVGRGGRTVPPGREGKVAVLDGDRNNFGAQAVSRGLSIEGENAAKLREGLLEGGAIQILAQGHREMPGEA